MNLEKDHYYHLVPESENRGDITGEEKNDERIIGSQSVITNTLANINNYALAGAILASTISILLGYGE